MTLGSILGVAVPILVLVIFGNVQDTADVTEASLDDPAWADVMLFGTPARFGSCCAASRTGGWSPTRSFGS